ncbi:MAG TPA: restriction endonuclease subunit S [Saprospiraceae bacterium]|nr:restriction endonuclease subunit S [Saprospiraceae bacterium]
MAAQMEKINLNNLDKSGWKTYRFEQIAKSISERVDPNNTDLKIYVGLEHLDAETIHIKRFGTPEDVDGQKLRCYPGDVIFGKRRAYQRKAALVDFDGFCSAHAMVLRANPEVMDPQLFPFFLHSDIFMHRAIDISVGSLSPTINWGTLKTQEFLLPPKDQQAKLAELLWAIDAVVEKEIEVLKRLEITLMSTVENEIHGIDISGKTIRTAINELSQKQKIAILGSFGQLLKGKGIPKSDVIDSGYPCVRYGELYTKHDKIIRAYYSYISEASKSSSIRLKKNDVLFAGSGETITEIGKSASFVDDIEAYAGGDTLIFRPKDMDGYYLGYLMNSQLVRQQLNKYGTGATVMHIYNSDLEKIKIPVRSRKDQEKIGKKLEQISQNIEQSKHKVETSKSLQKSLINQIF